jgi:ankyrin repeat protein
MRLAPFCLVVSVLAGTPDLFVAIRNGDSKGVQSQLRRELLRDVPNADHLTPLMYAVLTAGTPMMRVLLESGANVNAATPDGITALHMAAYDLAKTRLLIEHGAAVNSQTKSGETPLLLAAARPGSSAIVSLLLSKGARPGANSDGKTYLGGLTELSRAAANGDAGLMRLLLANGATVAGSPGIARSAAFGHCRECLALVLEGGADPNGATKSNRSAL